MAVLSGISKDTFKNLQLDAGVFVKNYDPSTGGAPTAANVLGATSGGGTFEAVPEMRDLSENIDGARGRMKGSSVIDSVEVKMTTTLKEMTAENFKLALGAATITPAGSSAKHDKITGKLQVEDSDYIPSICWLGTINGNAEPIIIEIKNVLSTGGLKFTFEDKSDGSIEVELMAHGDPAKPNELPYAIYVPKKAVV